MAFHLRVAGRVVARLAVADQHRLPVPILLALGLISLSSGAAILVASLAPYFVVPPAAAAFMPQSKLAIPNIDQSVLVAPAFPVVTGVPSPTAVGAATAPAKAPVDGVWFEIRIPALGYRAAVRQGIGSSVLDRGPGHYPTTPWPGHPGNVGVAAHNTFWLSFSHLKPGDHVQIQTQHGLFVYQITGSRVVSPTDRTVLAATSDDRLTLTTCYPLWAGAFATKRLVFTAREIGGVA